MVHLMFCVISCKESFVFKFIFKHRKKILNWMLKLDGQIIHLLTFESVSDLYNKAVIFYKQGM